MLSPVTFMDATRLSIFSWVVDFKIIWRIIHLHPGPQVGPFNKTLWRVVHCVEYPVSDSHTQGLILREERGHDLSSMMFQSSSKPLTSSVYNLQCVPSSMCTVFVRNKFQMCHGASFPCYIEEYLASFNLKLLLQEMPLKNVLIWLWWWLCNSMTILKAILYTLNW